MNEPSNICRTCLKQSPTFMSLNERLYDDCTFTIVDTIKKCLSIQLINRNESNNICLDCVEQVKQTLHFYESCSNSERMFSSVVTLTDINQESNDVNYERRDDLEQNGNTNAFESESSADIFTCHLCLPPLTLANFRDFHKHLAKNHEDTNGRVACNRCEKSYCRYRRLKVHLSVQHNVLVDSYCPKRVVRSKKIVPHEGGVKRVRTRCNDGFICPYCGVKVKAHTGLLSHIRYRHTKERPEVCEVCEATFVSRGEMRQHVLSKHTEKNLPCDECEKKFSTPYFLKKHKRCHRRQSHPCPLCSKVCNTKTSLQFHMQSHGDRKFHCKYCDKSFYCERHLRSHTYVHTGEKPVVCRFCPKAFTQYTSRKLHEQRYHKNELNAKEIHK